MSENLIITSIAAFFKERGKEIPERDADLFELQLIDSMELLELVMHLEERLGLEINQDMMTVDNFRTIDAIISSAQNSMGPEAM